MNGGILTVILSDSLFVCPQTLILLATSDLFMFHFFILGLHLSYGISVDHVIFLPPTKQFIAYFCIYCPSVSFYGLISIETLYLTPFLFC